MIDLFLSKFNFILGNLFRFVSYHLKLIAKYFIIIILSFIIQEFGFFNSNCLNFNSIFQQIYLIKFKSD
jgi:hypothetical protein